MSKKYKESTIVRKKHEILRAYVRLGMNISRVCKEVNISRFTFYNWKNGDEEFARKLQELEEGDLDAVEQSLRMLAKGVPKLDEKNRFIGWEEKPDLRAVLIYLRAKGGDRGYGGEVDTSKIDDVDVSKTEEELKSDILKLLKNTADYDGGGVSK